MGSVGEEGVVLTCARKGPERVSNLSISQGSYVMSHHHYSEEGGKRWGGGQQNGHEQKVKVSRKVHTCGANSNSLTTNQKQCLLIPTLCCNCIIHYAGLTEGKSLKKLL